MPEEVELMVNNGYKREVLKMIRTNGYNYSVILPPELIKEGYLRYNIVVKEQNISRTFPGDVEGSPFDWDFYDGSSYETRVVAKSNPIYLFNAKNDANLLVKEWRKPFELLPTKNENEGRRKTWS